VPDRWEIGNPIGFLFLGDRIENEVIVRGPKCHFSNNIFTIEQASPVKNIFPGDEFGVAIQVPRRIQLLVFLKNKNKKSTT
jgi:hypothetical protein